MQLIPNLVMREVDIKLLNYLVQFASQGTSVTIRVNDPVLLDADLTGNMRVVGEMILAQKSISDKVLLRVSTCEGEDVTNTVFLECFNIVGDDADVIKQNFFEGFESVLEFIGNNFAYTSPENVVDAINKSLEHAKMLVWEDGEVKIKK